MRLVADIGGTNARFALSPRPGVLEAQARLRVRDFAGPAEAVRAYLGSRPLPPEAVLAVATPVEGPEIAFTNGPWRFHADTLARTLGLRRLALINDFTAHALALPALGAGELERIGGGEREPTRPRLVLGPGTGLGAAALIPCGDFERPLPTEAGHMSLAPESARERALLAHLAPRLGHISRERLLSGPGLVLLARALAELDGRTAELRTPPEVVARARAGDVHAREAVVLFTDLLGGFAGDLALAHGARGGIYLAGGLLVALGELFDRERFRRRFEAKGRLAAWLRPIPVFRIRREDTGLLGASRYDFARRRMTPGWALDRDG